MTASSATSSSSWTTTSDAGAKFLGCRRRGGIAGLLALLLAAGLRDERLADAVDRAMAQAGRGDLPDRASALLLAISAISVLLERHGGADDPMPATFSLPAGADLRRLLLLLAAFAIYFLAMPRHRQHGRLGAVPVGQHVAAVG